MKKRLEMFSFNCVLVMSFLCGCIQDFPDYQPPVSNDVAVITQDANPNVDQGLTCGTPEETELGMPCSVAGGEVCGAWVCVDAVRRCEALPEDDSLPALPVEVCNGQDDNCDEIDDSEAFGLGSSCNMEVLVDGRPAQGTLICNPLHNASSGQDVSPTVCHCCLPDEQQCTGSPCNFMQVCSPTDEVCNDLDDDCDGTVDEGLDEPCDYQLDRCSVIGSQRCIEGLQTACTPPDLLPVNCRCLESAFPGGAHYLHCPVDYNWHDSTYICQGIRSGTTAGVAAFGAGKLLEIESQVEQDAVVNQLYQQVGRASKTWLNHRYDPATDQSDFDDWLAQYFPTGSYHRVDESDFDSDEERCLTLEEFPPYDWNFDLCVEDLNMLTCEFCADPTRDLDNDLHSPCEDDCDDMDPLVHGGRDEVCYNGKDDNCDGSIDEDCPCETRSFNGHQYVFCFDDGEIEHLNWLDARTKCRDWNMDLLVLNDLAEFNQMTVVARELANSQLFWVGVRQPTAGPDDEGDEADRARPWRWVQTGDLDVPNSAWWQDANRDRHDRDDRDCGRLYSQSANRRHIRPDKCDETYGYICESL